MGQSNARIARSNDRVDQNNDGITSNNDGITSNNERIAQSNDGIGRDHRAHTNLRCFTLAGGRGQEQWFQPEPSPRREKRKVDAIEQRTRDT
jgi:hypothetical protein